MKQLIKNFCVCLVPVILFFSIGIGTGLGQTPQDKVLLRQLQELPKLVRPHYCWPCNKKTLLEEDPLLVEYTRIIGSLGIKGEWWGPKHLDPDEMQAAIRICSKSGASITLNYSPFHRLIADSNPKVPNDRELYLYQRSLQLVKEHLDTWNRLYKTDVKIQAVLLDTEHFIVQRVQDKDTGEWDLAIQAKLVPFYSSAKLILGKEVKVYWYDHGMGVNTPWWRHPPYLPGDGVNCSLYNAAYRERTALDYRNGFFASRREHQPLIFWIALGGGWDWSADKKFWNRNLKYPASNSVWMGNWLNQSSSVDAVVFHPGPFPPNRNLPWPEWNTHFQAYVKGATSVSSLGATK